MGPKIDILRTFFGGGGADFVVVVVVVGGGGGGGGGGGMTPRPLPPPPSDYAAGLGQLKHVRLHNMYVPYVPYYGCQILL